MKNAIKNGINFLFPNLGKKARIYRLKKILHSAPQITSDGVKFWGAQVYDNYEKNIHNVLIKLMGRCDLFINVGANHGVYCLKLSKLSDCVLAFEAFPDNLKLLFKNINENGLKDKIIVYPVAVGSTESLVTFYGASTGGSLLKGWNQQSDFGITLPLHSLDGLIYSKIIEKQARPLFLIDVEGAEYEVVKGAFKIISEVPGCIFCIEIPCKEFMPDEIFNPHFLDIFEQFFKLGYLAWEIKINGELCKINLAIVTGFFQSARYEGVMVVFSKEEISGW